LAHKARATNNCRNIFPPSSTVKSRSIHRYARLRRACSEGFARQRRAYQSALLILEQGLFEPIHRQGHGALCVIAAESVTGAGNRDEVRLDVVFPEGLKNDLAIPDIYQFVLVTMNQQRRGIVRRHEQERRIVGSLLFLKVQGREAVQNRSGGRWIQAASY